MSEEYKDYYGKQSGYDEEPNYNFVAEDYGTGYKPDYGYGGGDEEWKTVAIKDFVPLPDDKFDIEWDKEKYPVGITEWTK